MSKIERPWIIDGEVKQIYSRIDKPLYTLTNGTLFEHFELMTIQRSNTLGIIVENNFIWNENISNDFYERRGNFENLTLIAMTDEEKSYNQLPKNWKSLANVSNILPKSFEV